MKTVVLIIAAGFTLLYPVNKIEPGRVALPLIKLAHQYHGIYHSYGTDEGRLRFDRDGQHCKLLTQGFVDWVRERRK